MAIAKHEPAPAWRNVAAWSAVAAIPYILAMGVALTLMHRDGIRAIARPDVALVLCLSLIAATAVVGVTRRRRALDARNFRNFLIGDTLAVSLFLLAIWTFRTLGGARAMGASEAFAAFTGLTLILSALAGILVTASARAGTDLTGDDVTAEEMRERGKLFFSSFLWLAVCGLLLIGLSVSGPEGPLPPSVALPGALALIAALTGLGIAAWRLSDELGRTLSHETGNMAFYLIVMVGGGWSVLARLGFVAGPAPLDWVTLFAVLLLLASVIALGRRKLLAR